MHIQSFNNCEKYFFKILSRIFVELPFCDIYLTGVEASSLNLIVQKAPLNSVNDIQTVCGIATELKVPWSWVFKEEYLTSTTQQILADHHIHLTDQSVAMMHTLGFHQPQLNNFDLNLTIREASSDLKDWARPLRSAFESSVVVARQYRETHLKAQQQQSHFYHFVGYLDDIPVGSLTLSMNGRMGRIDDVGVTPKYQRQGIATRLLKHALKKCQSLGSTHCFLEASQMGLSLYQKIGFEPLFTYHIYEKSKC